MRGTTVMLAVLTTTAATPLAAASVQALFSDQTTDQVLFAKDLNDDGDTNDAGEITAFFDAANQNGLATPTGNVFNIVQARSGDVFIGDGASDTVYRLRDRNGDNNAQGAGESSVWFSAANADGNPLLTANGIAEGNDGAIYVVQADTRGNKAGDFVYRTEDLNGDGDANDAGESKVWLDLTALNAGSSPFEIAFDGNVAYIADTAGGSPRIYKAEDVNGDGTVDASEVGEFIKSSDRVFALSVAADAGNLYSYDFIGDALARYTDLDGSGDIDMASERVDVWDATGFADGAIFDFIIEGNTALVTVNDFSDDDTLLKLTDLNGDGDFLDAGETATLLQFSQQGTYPQRPRAITFYDSVAPVPLPASVLFLGAGLAGLGALGRRKRG
ncbi:MAG: VPLPA-CTERM sorting domain-containing protein [Silicimonas sp.]|nr:VPLPA-CTERM sorting domain-containing protein [Silicimonas sp.]